MSRILAIAIAPLFLVVWAILALGEAMYRLGRRFGL